MTSPWRKPSRSASAGNNNCVEARNNAEIFEVRDSKLGEGSPVLGVTAPDFAGLLATLKTGKLAG